MIFWGAIERDCLCITKGRKTDALFNAAGTGQTEIVLWLLATEKFKVKNKDGSLWLNYANRSHVDVCSKSNNVIQEALEKWGSKPYNDMSARSQGLVNGRKTAKERKAKDIDVAAKRKARAQNWRETKGKGSQKGSPEPTITCEPAHGKGSKRPADLQEYPWAGKQKK